jgi:peptidoglycan/LPS O-acetylase OafA/YrhL
MPRRDPLPALTPLRFFAALAVFVFHVRCAESGQTHERSFGFFHLATGVSFFFVLSGFILTYNYLDELRHPTRRGAWNFLVARWARIYPVHLLGCLVFLPFTYKPLVSGWLGNPLEVVCEHVFLAHGFLPEIGLKGNALNPPSWSLSAEWFFYLLLPALIPGLTTGSRRRRGAVLLLCLAPWLGAVAGTVGLFSLPTWFSPYRYPPVRLADFVAGVLLGVYWHRRSAPGAIIRPALVRATLVEVGALLVAGGWAWACVVVSPTPIWALTARWVGVYTPSFLLLIWVFARGGGLVSRVLSARPLVYLGELSYAFYMLHFAVLAGAGILALRLGLNPESVLWPWGVGALTLALSAACYHLYEIPLRDWLRRKLSVRCPRVEAAATETDLHPFPAPVNRAA